MLKKDVVIYPNPSPGIIYVDLKDVFNKRAQILITNENGNVIRELNTESSNIFLNMKKYGLGVYYFKITIHKNNYFKKIEIVDKIL